MSNISEAIELAEKVIKQALSLEVFINIKFDLPNGYQDLREKKILSVALLDLVEENKSLKAEVERLKELLKFYCQKEAGDGNG